MLVYIGGRFAIPGKYMLFSSDKKGLGSTKAERFDAAAKTNQQTNKQTLHPSKVSTQLLK